MQLRSLRIVVAAAIVSTASVATAAPWNFNAAGQNSRFGWSTNHASNLLGQTQGPWMGSPVVTEDGVFFNSAYAMDPMNFTVDAANPQRSTDERWVMSTVPSGAGGAIGLQGSNPPGAPRFESITFIETGTYVSDNPAADFGGSNQSAFLFVYAPIPTVVPFTPLNVTFNQDGTWIATAVIDLLALPGGLGADTMEIHLINTLTVSPTAPNSSMTKLTASVIIPEPASLLLILGAAPTLLIRRRR